MFDSVWSSDRTDEPTIDRMPGFEPKNLPAYFARLQTAAIQRGGDVVTSMGVAAMWLQAVAV